MACEPPSPPPPKRQKSPAAAPTTICALGDDLLREIFLRLPSLPTLVRAALTCRASLRAVRSSPAFRRRFRELHSAALLGVFLDIFESDTPAFRPLRLHPDPDLAAADCHDGRVVLVSYNSEHMAVYDPFTRALDLFPRPPGEICEDMYVEYHVLSSDEDRGPLSVVCVCHEACGAQAAVLSSETGEWQVFPFVDAAAMQPGDDGEKSSGNGMLVNGSIYWTDGSQSLARVLNTSTLHFSRIDLPPRIEGQGALTAGGTKDGRLCIITTVKLALVVWFRRTDDDGSERWTLQKTFQLEQDVHARDHCFGHDRIAMKVLAIVNGFVYLSTYCEPDRDLPGLFLSFCLETAKLNKLCTILHIDSLYPYIMAWPPCLVLNEVSP
ncbi:hypothetical protein D1007_50576 [Hordeum vulgare]|nr:hypothetical protein D1007_50576 [Hordeum vulgare]